MQTSIAYRSIITGLSLLIVGMVYGTFIASGTLGHPVLTLATHIQFLLNGMLAIIAGLVLNTPSFCRMSSTALLIYDMSIYALWPHLTSEIIGNFYGIAFPRLVKAANLPPVDPQMYGFRMYLFVHYIPAAMLLFGLSATLVHCIWPVPAGMSRNREQIAKR